MDSLAAAMQQPSASLVTTNAVDASTDLSNKVKAKEWTIGQIVTVKPRTWAGINRPGGRGRVTAVHVDDATGEIGKIDVKYILGGFDKLVDLHYVEKHAEEPEKPAAGRPRRQRKAVTNPSKDDGSDGDGDNNNNNNIAKPTPKMKLDFDAAGCGEGSSSKNKKKRSLTSNNENAENNHALSLSVAKKKAITNKSDMKKTNKPTAQRKLSAADTGTSYDFHVPSTIVVDRPAFSSPSSISSHSRFEGLASTPTREQPYISSESARRCLHASPAGYGHLSHSRAAARSLSSVAATPVATPVKARWSSAPTTPVSGKVQGTVSLSNSKNIHPLYRREDRSLLGGSNRVDKKPSPIGKALVLATLQSEHGRIMNGASQFIKEVVVSDKSPARLNEREQESLQKKALPAPPSSPGIDEELLAKFFRALQAMWDDIDGEGVEEDNLAGEINKHCDPGYHFSSLQIKDLVQHLVKQNKVMKSDGQLYLV